MNNKDSFPFGDQKFKIFYIAFKETTLTFKGLNVVENRGNQ